ncbi:MAG: SIS domain-containing protein [bacterium]
MTENFEKEIKQQPQIIKSILKKHLKNDVISGFDDIKNFKKITLIASGTSKNAGDFAAYYFEQIAKIPSKVEFASEILEKDVIFDADDLVIFISQSGKSTDVLLSLEKVKKTKAQTLAITNKIDSPVSVDSDFKLDMEAGEELAIPATKSFSATVVKLYLLAIYFAQKKGIDTKNLTSEVQNLPDAAEKIMKSDLVEKTAKDFDAKIFLGRGLCYFAFNEIGLKLKEAALEKTTCRPLGEYVHGHMVTLESTDSILAASFTFNEIHQTDLNLIERVKKSYNPKIEIITEELFPLKSRFLTPLLMVFLYQLVACEVAKKKGLNADKPSGLNKVTT